MKKIIVLCLSLMMFVSFNVMASGFSEPLDSLPSHKAEFQAKQRYTLRGSMRNSFLKFEREKKGRVAFLGGSITEMYGWHNLVMDQLQSRFPETEFDFVEAGVSSTGSTPGAFRLDNDILSRGAVDLLFVEAAVNDDTNGFTPEQQVRGMEGIIRHSLESNPDMDIMMLYFIYEPFIVTLDGGRVPDVLLNHERVANHYRVPSVNLIQEIYDRMLDGELTWKEFGGTHPALLGHEYYAAAIQTVLDTLWRKVPLGAIDSTGREKMAAHEIPAAPLDAFSYCNGRFLDIRQAKLKKGFEYVPSWRPDDKYEKRDGFVDVPFLEAKKPGSELRLSFEGTAIGIFGVFGPSSGRISYSIDNEPFKEMETFTDWSGYLYIPWLYTLETELSPASHTLVLRVAKGHHPRSHGTELQIRNFVTNDL